MNRAAITINRAYTKGWIDRRLFGSFVEHMGRVVYSGIYEKDHPLADEDGFRTDVIDATRSMGVTAVRYPGGNFVSGYDWLDGIGPVSRRPKKRDLAWKSIETNEVGIDEFMKWADKTRIEPILAVNLGTAGIREAVSFLEYVNSEAGTSCSDLRVENGHPEPYRVKTWCLGNEMDGEWQIGHRTAREYARLAHETGKAMKLLDPSIQLAVCGSSLSSRETCPDWDQEVIRETYDYADYISLHQYYGGQEKGTAAFLSQSLDLERFIKAIVDLCDVEKFRRRSGRTIDIALDEWGVWSISDKQVEADVAAHPWRIAPAFSEQIYSLEDSLLFASMLMAMLKHADRVKIGCQSLLTNISACIMTVKGGGIWFQPIYYVFSLMAENCRGLILEERSDEDGYSAGGFEKVPCIDHVTVYDEERQRLVFCLVNRAENDSEAVFSMEGFQPQTIILDQVLSAKDRKDNNSIDHDKVVPQACDNALLKDGKMTVRMQPLSFEMVSVSLA